MSEIDSVSRGPNPEAVTNSIQYKPYADDGFILQDSAPAVIKKDVTEVGAPPYSANKKLPSTLIVKTAALLELHAMRQSAVDLCMQLPRKVRTRSAQCADIFEREIRLEALAKEK